MRRTLIVAGASLALLGCLEREESLDVGADGAVRVVHTIEGDPDDFEDGRAGFPDPDTYSVSQEVREVEGRQRRRMTATARFESVAQVPTQMGEGNGAYGVRTTLRTYDEEGLTRYVLVRTYAPRAWAPYRQGVLDGLGEGLQKLVSGELGDEERGVILELLVSAEREKLIRLADDALEARFGDVERLPLARLAARREIERICHEELTAERLNNVLNAAPGEREELARVLRMDLERTIAQEAGAALRLGESEVEDLREQLEQERVGLGVTDDLADEAFVVRVRLPGRLAEHNGQLQDGWIVWRFSGQALRDREHTLIASSFTTDTP